MHTRCSIKPSPPLVIRNNLLVEVIKSTKKVSQNTLEKDERPKHQYFVFMEADVFMFRPVSGKLGL